VAREAVVAASETLSNILRDTLLATHRKQKRTILPQMRADRAQVQVDENRQVNIVMAVGAVTESIQVQAELTRVETRSGAVREVVDSARIVEMPRRFRRENDGEPRAARH
jgi:hypothetical protein